MRIFKPLLVTTLMSLVAACAYQASAPPPVEPRALDAIAAAVADPTRLDDHRARDAARRPEDILVFAGVAPGDKVADIAAAGGYYTAILSRLVGPAGHVYAVDPARIFEAFPAARDGFPKFIAADPRENVSYTVQKLDAFSVPEPLDAIVIALYYHDTYWTGEDRAAMNAAFFKALKPGGALLIIDHHALPGAAAEVTKDLHRMDAALVEPALAAAGFYLAGESGVLAHPDDPRDINVFDESIRGRTDRFVYLFRKPA